MLVPDFAHKMDLQSPEKVSVTKELDLGRVLEQEKTTNDKDDLQMISILWIFEKERLKLK